MGVEIKIGCKDAVEMKIRLQGGEIGSEAHGDGVKGMKWRGVME